MFHADHDVEERLEHDRSQNRNSERVDNDRVGVFNEEIEDDSVEQYRCHPTRESTLIVADRDRIGCG